MPLGEQYQFKVTRSMKRLGKTVILRKLISASWLDFLGFAHVQKIDDTNKLFLAGIMNIGDCIAYVMTTLDIPWSKEKFIFDHEYEVFDCEPYRIHDQFIYWRLLCKRTFNSESACMEATPDEFDLF